MAFKKKTWSDRMVEYAGRRKLTNVSTKQAIICDVERSEGTVSKEGDAFSSQNMNDLEQRVADGFSEVKQTTDGLIQNLGGVKIIPEGSGAATKYYAQLGADATSKKLLGIELIKLGSEAGTYDLSSYTGWESFSGNNFLITSKAYAASASYGNNGRPFGTNTTSSEPVKTYENGILTVSESDTGEIWDSNKQYYIRAATIVTGVYLIY